MTLTDVFTPTKAPTNTSANQTYWTNLGTFYLSDGGAIYELRAQSFYSNYCSTSSVYHLRVLTNITSLSYVNSSNASEYPDNGVVDGWLYEKAGYLGANCVSGQQTGSGRIGMTINIGFRPRLLIVSELNTSTSGGHYILHSGSTYSTSYINNGNYGISASLGRETVLAMSSDSTFPTTKQYGWIAFR